MNFSFRTGRVARVGGDSRFFPSWSLPRESLIQSPFQWKRLPERSAALLLLRNSIGSDGTTHWRGHWALSCYSAVASFIPSTTTDLILASSLPRTPSLACARTNRDFKKAFHFAPLYRISLRLPEDLIALTNCPLEVTSYP